MTLVVVCDACVLYPFHLRDFLLRLAEEDAIRVRWSKEILDECFGNLAADEPKERKAALTRTRRLMEKHFPEAMVEDHQRHIPGVQLPDPDDRHVVAAAIKGRADGIVTTNLKDFPVAVCRTHGIEIFSPDDLVLQLLSSHSEAIVRVIKAQSADLKNPPLTPIEVIDGIARGGLGASAAILRGLV